MSIKVRLLNEETNGLSLMFGELKEGQVYRVTVCDTREFVGSLVFRVREYLVILHNKVVNGIENLNYTQFNNEIRFTPVDVNLDVIFN